MPKMPKCSGNALIVGTLIPKAKYYGAQCPFYSELREGKSLDSDLDLVKYVIEVLKIRDEKVNNEE